MLANIKTFDRKLNELRTMGGELSQTLRRASTNLTQTGSPPAKSIVIELAKFRRQAAELRTELGGVTAPKADEPFTLKTLEVLIEKQRIAQQAIDVLEDILALTHSEQDDFAPLLECRENAKLLHQRLSGSSEDWPEEELKALVEGKHRFCQLRQLIFEEDNIDDDQWGELQEQVTEEFGRAFATAIARGKITAAATPRQSAG